MHNKAAEQLTKHMEKAFLENPRGELYRSLTVEDLLNKLRQNVAEIEVSLAHGGNDLGDKLADTGNYVAFIYRNIFDPVTSESYLDRDAARDILEALRARHLTKDEAKRISHAAYERVRKPPSEGIRVVLSEGYPPTSGFGKIGPEDDNTP